MDMVSDNNVEKTSSEIRYLSSGVDDSGRVFVLDGEIYRALTPEGRSVFDALTRAGVLGRLNDVGLIGTEKSEMSFEDHPVVLRHKRIPFISYCQEWPFEMLRQAALLQCRLMRELVRSGFATKDAHPWNIAFDFSRPVFLDFGSITFLDEASLSWWIEEFRTHFYVPLWLIRHKRFSLARWCMKEHPAGLIKKVMSHRMSRKALVAFEKIVAQAGRKGFTWFLDRLIEHLGSLDISYPEREWSNYGHAEWKMKFVAGILGDLEVRSLIDIGANRGAFSTLAADLGLSVVALDVDEYSIGHLYRQSSLDKKAVLPLVVNFLRPTPPFGIGLFHANSWDRLRCDMGIMLGMIHHLAFRNNVNFETAAEIAGRYVRRYLLVEFVPKNDKYVAEWDESKEKRYEWYTEERFVKAFMKRFKGFKKWDSPVNERKLYLFEA